MIIQNIAPFFISFLHLIITKLIKNNKIKFIKFISNILIIKFITNYLNKIINNFRGDFFMKLDFKVLVIGISIPTIFTLLWQIGAVIELIFPNVTIFVNLDTFITFLLVFLASIGVSLLLNANLKKSLVNGIFIGFFGEVVTLLIIIFFALLIQLTSSSIPMDIFTIDIFYYYIIPNLIFQMLNGVLGGFIGYNLVQFKNK